MEAIERATVSHQRRPFGLEHLEDRLVFLFRMRLHLGVADALVSKPAIEIVERLERQARREEPLAHHTDLVFDLALFPTRCRTACGGLDEMMAHQPLEAPVERALLAGEDRLDGSFHIGHAGGMRPA
jgi:hypothetical protein